MGRPKRDEKEKRSSQIKIACTLLEKEEISLKAKKTGLPSSVYMRNIALNYPLKSVVDQVALDELIRAKADLGRLGGLFKKWLTHNDDTKLKLGTRSWITIDNLVDEMEKKQSELLSLAREMIKNKVEP